MEILKVLVISNITSSANIKINDEEHNLILDYFVVKEEYRNNKNIGELIYENLKKIKKEYNIVIHLLGNCEIISKNILYKSLVNFAKSKKLIGIRHSDNYIKNPKNSPRVPFVDTHFIAFNCDNSRYKKFLKNYKFIESNYDKYCGQNMNLILFIEKNFNINEVYNFFNNGNFNIYGDLSNQINTFPFSYCNNTSLITYYPKFNKKVKKLLLLNKNKKKLKYLIFLKKGLTIYWLSKFAKFINNISLKIFNNRYKKFVRKKTL